MHAPNKPIISNRSDSRFRTAGFPAPQIAVLFAALVLLISIPIWTHPLPPLFMVGFHAFVSVSIDRYNLPMIIVFAFIIASYVDDRFIQPYLERRASSPAA